MGLCRDAADLRCALAFPCVSAVADGVVVVLMLALGNAQAEIAAVQPTTPASEEEGAIDMDATTTG
jgi:hypothetical protein